MSQSKGTRRNRQGIMVGGRSSNFVLATRSQIYFMLEKQNHKYSQWLGKAKNKINFFFLPACLVSLTWCKRDKHTWHEVSGCLWILLIIFTFWRLLFMKKWNIDDWLVSQIKGWDLRCSEICLYFYDRCLLCWFCEMNTRRKKLKTLSSIYCLIFHSSGNEIRLFQLSEMPAFSSALIFLGLDPTSAWKLHFFPFSFSSFSFLR